MSRPDEKSFYWKCHSVNARHAQFILFDPKGANCGTVYVLTEDVDQFLRAHKAVDWNDWTDPRKAKP